MTDRSEETKGPAAPTGIVLDERQIRLLRMAVIAMGVVLVLGFGAVIARIVYLVARSGESRPAAATASSVPVSSASLDLPSGASVRHIAITGDRLAVHYEAPSGPGIAILDITSGRVVSRIALMPSAPR